MFNFTCHERIRILLKDSQAGTGAEIDALAAVISAGVICWVFEFASTGGFIFRQWSWGGLCQIFEILFEFM